jgi:hypothetical protein
VLGDAQLSFEEGLRCLFELLFAILLFGFPLLVATVLTCPLLLFQQVFLTPEFFLFLFARAHAGTLLYANFYLTFS